MVLTGRVQRGCETCFVIIIGILAARKVRDYNCVSIYNSVKYTTLSVLSFGKYYNGFLYTILYVL